MRIASRVPLTGRLVIVSTRIRLTESWCSQVVQSVIHHEGRLSREEAARALCLSPVQFSRNFRRVFGFSFRTAQMFLRLYLGAHYLGYTPLRISEIAARLNYGDLKKFERAFKEHFHMSPSQYRRWSKQQEADHEMWLLLNMSIREEQNEMSWGNAPSMWSDKLCA
jgi:AraC-like DNA-binding protein